MEQGVSHFNRYELKFWTDRRTRRELLTYLLHFMEPDPHCVQNQAYRITSLYLETHELLTYSEKYNGDLQRRKYRVRFYDGDPSRLFFEVKSKYNAFVKKSRSEMQMNGRDFTDIPALIRREDASLNREFVHGYHALGLQPMVWVDYRRFALRGRHNPSLRVTFDEALGGCSANDWRWDANRLRPLALSRWKEPIILEIKFSGQFPFWLETAMRDFGFIHESISKYGMLMARHYFHEKREQWIH